MSIFANQKESEKVPVLRFQMQVGNGFLFELNFRFSGYFFYRYMYDLKRENFVRQVCTQGLLTNLFLLPPLAARSAKKTP